MRAYQTIGLLLVVGGLAFTAGMHVGERRSAQTPARNASDGSCCTLPLNPAAQNAPKLKIPTGSGLPCLVEFGSNECDACKRMAVVLRELTPKLKATADLVQVDTALYPGEAQRWRLRMVPTQILLDAHGQEQWRHEGFIAAAELLARVTTAAESKSSPATTRRPDA